MVVKTVGMTIPWYSKNSCTGTATLPPDAMTLGRIQAVEDAMKMLSDEVQKHAGSLQHFHNITPEDAQGLAARLKSID